MCYLIHDPKHLQCKHVLPKVIACLEDCVYRLLFVGIFEYKP